MAIPTLMNPHVTRASCQGGAARPAAVMGDIAAVPRIAATVVMTQFAYVPEQATLEIFDLEHI